jgi:TolB-like protein
MMTPSLYTDATLPLSAQGEGSFLLPVADLPGAHSNPLRDSERKKKKARKVRNVWISFTGRILAQFVGSAASILLGLALVQNFKSGSSHTARTEPVAAPARDTGHQALRRVSGVSGRRSLVVLPVEDLSLTGEQDRFATALTELLTAELAGRPALSVLSRTTATQLRGTAASVPELARELGVDLVLESSVTRSGQHVRVVAQLIDGRSDEHIWVGRFDRDGGDALALQAEVAGLVGRGVEAAITSAPTSASQVHARLGTGDGVPASLVPSTPSSRVAALTERRTDAARPQVP